MSVRIDKKKLENGVVLERENGVIKVTFTNTFEMVDL